MPITDLEFGCNIAIRTIDYSKNRLPIGIWNAYRSIKILILDIYDELHCTTLRMLYFRRTNLAKYIWNGSKPISNYKKLGRTSRKRN